MTIYAPRRAPLCIRGGGGNASKPKPTARRVSASSHKAIPLLLALDGPFLAAVRSGAIKFVRTEAMLDDSIMRDKIVRRQRLEEIERERGIQIFLTPSEAVATLQANGRNVGALTYGWTTPDHCDPSGAYLAAVRRFLRSSLGEHVTACFWDFMSLPQKPRTPEEAALFKQAIAVMGDTYASTLGTTVMRHRTVPLRPAEFDGDLVVLVDDDAAAGDGAGAGGALDSEEAVRAALGAHGPIEAVRREEGRWRVRFASHEAAEAAAAAGPVEGALACFCYWNGRLYGHRGWTCFETGVSTEALTRAVYYPKLRAVLEELPPKLVEIDGEAPVVAANDGTAAGDEGAGPRIARVRGSIEAATFTGKGDKEVVLRLLRDYMARIGNAMAESGEGVEGTYEGERNAAGEKEGRGKFVFATGNVYEGEFKADKKEGRGKYVFADGNVYEGEWKAGMQEGRGKYVYASGNVEVGFYKADQDVGEGVKWSADGQSAWRLEDGQPVAAISLAEARRIAETHSLPIPEVAGSLEA